MSDSKEGTLFKSSVVINSECEEVLSFWIESRVGYAPSVYGLPGNTQSEISIYQETDDQLLSPSDLESFIQSLIDNQLNPGSFSIQQSYVEKEDWAESWKTTFQPIYIQDRICVRPSWEKKPKQGTIDIVLDPGLSFGTGHHETTHYCLEKILEFSTSPDIKNLSFLDAGTGSGILSIAAFHLGFHNIKAFDNDAEAITCALNNARDNSAHFELFQGTLGMKLSNVAENEQFDLITANILAKTLISEVEHLSDLARPGAKIIAAGILVEQFHELVYVFSEHNLHLVHELEDGEWKSGTFQKRFE